MSLALKTRDSLRPGADGRHVICNGRSHPAKGGTDVYVNLCVRVCCACAWACLCVGATVSGGRGF